MPAHPTPFIDRLVHGVDLQVVDVELRFLEVPGVQLPPVVAPRLRDEKEVVGGVAPKQRSKACWSLDRNTSWNRWLSKKNVMPSGVFSIR